MDPSHQDAVMEVTFNMLCESQVLPVPLIKFLLNKPYHMRNKVNWADDLFLSFFQSQSLDNSVLLVHNALLFYQFVLAA